VSEEATVYGCIMGMHGSTANWYGLYPLNRAVIEGLPEGDDYPPLTRSLFTVPMDYGKPGGGFYRRQIIHFGASFNHLSDFWHIWLTKFEALLRRLYWVEAHLHLDIELYGQHAYAWRALSTPFFLDPPALTTEWHFQGGPRDFRSPADSAG
jgi:hypothetical protein